VWESGSAAELSAFLMPCPRGAEPVVLPPAHLHLPEDLGPPLLRGESNPWVLLAACPLCSPSSSLFSGCSLRRRVSRQQTPSGGAAGAPVGVRVEALPGAGLCVCPAAPAARDGDGDPGPRQRGREGERQAG